MKRCRYCWRKVTWYFDKFDGGYDYIDQIGTCDKHQRNALEELDGGRTTTSSGGSSPETS